MEAFRIVALLVATSLVGAAGCALWKSDEDIPPSELPPVRVASDSVVLEIARLTLNEEDEETTAGIWREIDEQMLPLDRRRRMAENGFRAGLISYHLPQALREIIERNKGSRSLNGGDLVRIDGEESAVINRRRFPRGKRGEYVMVTTRKEVNLLEAHEGSLRGETLFEAECKFILRASPQNDGRVRLEVTPEIHHGRPKQHYVASEGMLRIETGKERRVLEDVAFTALLEEGQTLILSGTDPLKGPARVYFEREHGGRTRRQLLLIRIAGSEFDDLFHVSRPDASAAALAETPPSQLVPASFDETTGD